MELEEMKTAWQALNQRLEQQQALNLTLVRENHLVKARRGLRPLFWGQVLQVMFGLVLTLAGGSFWPDHRDAPYQLLAGLIVHAYGIATTVLGGITLGKIANLDYSAPVTIIQKQLALLRVFYVRSGMILGLSWWLLCIPFVMVAFGLLGVDLYAAMPKAIHIGIISGVFGLLATWLIHRWSRHSNRPQFARMLDDGLAGGSLTKARKILDELKRFETDLE